MSIIEKMGYVDYFLIVWDFINYARSVEISVGPGRGSGAGSIVAYSLGITIPLVLILLSIIAVIYSAHVDYLAGGLISIFIIIACFIIMIIVESNYKSKFKKQILSSIVNKYDSNLEYFSDGGFDMGEYFAKCISKDKEISTRLMNIIKRISSPDFIIGDYFESIDPYVTLRILAENKKNLDYEVEWRYADVVEGGWVRKKELYKELDNSDKITIVTEGSTDSFILKKTISELYPNIADFFTFIDMKENYPFTGVGNLCNFCQGLDKINVINNIMVIFYNDTAGLISFDKAIKSCKSKNICITHLPNMVDFKRIKACGPNGEIYCDINGKAVAIECFLDFKSVIFNPCIRWSTFYENVNKYQGSLINKDA